MGTESLAGPGIRQKVEFLTQLFEEAPVAARFDVPSATAILDAGLAFRALHPSGSAVATDMPLALGGTETAPSPYWLLAAATASCCASVIALRAAAVGIGLRTLEVSLAAEADVRGLLGIGDGVSASLDGIRLLVEIGADGATDDELRDLVRWAVAHSPVLATIRDTSPVVVDIEIA